MIYAEEAWVLVSSGTHVQPQVMLDPDYLPDYLSISYDYVKTNKQEKKARLTQKHTTTIGPKNQTQQPQNKKQAKQTNKRMKKKNHPTINCGARTCYSGLSYTCVTDA